MSNPLALSLLLAFHDNATIHSDLPAWISKFQVSKLTTTYDTVLKDSIAELRESLKERRESQLTMLVKDKINLMNLTTPAAYQVELMDTSTGKMGMIDILVGKETPDLVIQVGQYGCDWFQKLDQGIIYLKLMCQKDVHSKFKFQKPLLLAVITLDKLTPHDDSIEFQLGLFLCCQKESQSNAIKDNFRMLLLWQSRTTSLQEATKLFGRTLRIAEVFGKNKDRVKQNAEGYKYLSSNCCKIKDRVRRISCTTCCQLVLIPACLILNVNSDDS